MEVVGKLFTFSSKFTFLILLGVAFALHADNSANKYAYSLSRIDYLDGICQRVFADFDGDGLEEYIETKGVGVTLVDFDEANWKTCCHLAGYFKITEIASIEYSGDETPEIIFSIKRDSVLYFQLWNSQLVGGEIACQLLLESEKIVLTDRNNDTNFDGKISSFAATDLNGDRQKDILVTLNAGYDYYDRGVWAFDGATGKIIWQFKIAGIPFPSKITGNSLYSRKIILGSYAPDNGYTINNMSDSLVYLICLNPNGRLLWQQIVGKRFSSTKYTIDSFSDREPVIICTAPDGNEPDTSTVFEIQIRNLMDGDLEKNFKNTARFSSPLILDWNQDHSKEILSTDKNGYIYEFDSDLQLRRKVKLASALDKLSIQGAVDLDSNGEPEILLFNHNSLQLIDHNFHTLADYRFGSSLTIYTAHFFNHPVYGPLVSIISGRNSKNLGAQILKITKNSFWERILANNFLNTGTLIFFSFLAGVFLGLIGFRVIHKKHVPVKKSEKKIEEKRNQLLDAISAFGHGKTTTANLDRLNFLFKNLAHQNDPSPEYASRIDEAVSSYFNFSSLQIHKIVDFSKLAKTSSTLISALEEHLEKLESILTDYQSHRKISKIPHTTIKEIPKLIENLEDDIRKISVELSRYFKCRVIYSIDNVISAFQAHNRTKINFRELSVKGGLGIKAFINPIDFSEVLEELLQNAACAMKDSPVQDISIHIQSEDHHILIDISDTGCGIQTEDLENIFNRDYSTKNQGGFGLYHARMILGRYRGKIRVLRSEVNNGTTMRIELKKV